MIAVIQTFVLNIEITQLIEILLLAFLGFAFSILITPLYTTLAYKGEWWKKARSTAVTGEKAKVFNKLHAEKHRSLIPTMAGIVFLVSVTLVTIAFNLVREETWLPLAAFVGAGFIGLVDDIINIRGSGKGVAGLPSKLKLLLITIVALIGGWFFYAKLDVTSVNVPVYGDLSIGWLVVPLFVLVVISTANAVNITDGLDGLAGGLTAIAFGNYAIIAFLQERYGVAGFCMTVVGALLAYTWFNIFPARFFMGDVGSFALGTALAAAMRGSVSSGLMVCRLMTIEPIPSLSSARAATSALYTKLPVAIIATFGLSDVQRVIAFPISKGVSDVVKRGVPALPNLI
jgi:phospho-N-acetylmuramoyl-pentapeptide-transferase